VSARARSTIKISALFAILPAFVSAGRSRAPDDGASRGGSTNRGCGGDGDGFLRACSGASAVAVVPVDADFGVVGKAGCGGVGRTGRGAAGTADGGARSTEAGTSGTLGATADEPALPIRAAKSVKAPTPDGRGDAGSSGGVAKPTSGAAGVAIGSSAGGSPSLAVKQWLAGADGEATAGAVGSLGHAEDGAGGVTAAAANGVVAGGGAGPAAAGAAPGGACAGACAGAGMGTGAGVLAGMLLAAYARRRGSIGADATSATIGTFAGATGSACAAGGANAGGAPNGTAGGGRSAMVFADFLVYAHIFFSSCAVGDDMSPLAPNLQHDLVSFSALGVLNRSDRLSASHWSTITICHAIVQRQSTSVSRAMQSVPCPLPCLKMIPLYSPTVPWFFRRPSKAFQPAYIFKEHPISSPWANRSSASNASKTTQTLPLPSNAPPVLSRSPPVLPLPSQRTSNRLPNRPLRKPPTFRAYCL